MPLMGFTDESRAAAGEAWLAASAYALDGTTTERDEAGIRARVAAADSFVHLQDLPETDVLLASDYAAHEAGFAAAQTPAKQQAKQPPGTEVMVQQQRRNAQRQKAEKAEEKTVLGRLTNALIGQRRLAPNARPRPAADKAKQQPGAEAKDRASIERSPGKVTL